MAASQPHGTRRFAAGCLATLLIAPGCAGTPDRPGPSFTRIEFRSEQLATTEASIPGAVPAGQSTGLIVLETGPSGTVEAIYTLMRDARDQPAVESTWTAKRPGDHVRRDWRTCTTTTSEPPGTLRSAEDMLADLLGPRTPPPGTRSRTWETEQGMSRVRITETGPAYTDRIVETLDGDGVATSRISGVRRTRTAVMPSPLPGWDTCQARVTAGGAPGK